MSVVDLSHLVNSKNLNNYSNITNTKGNTLLNNLSYQDNECIVINNSTTMHVAPAMENNSRHNTSTITKLVSVPLTPDTIAHKHIKKKITAAFDIRTHRIIPH
jgi:alpha-ketoglutarate-dependent taurine dioxygenase